MDDHSHHPEQHPAEHAGKDNAGHDHGDHHDHGGGGGINAVAISATLHCLTGCAIGEIAGMVIGSALGWSDLATIALAVTLAFLFGYTLTSIPLLRAGFAVGAVIPLALASDTVSIAVMEVVDNAIMLLIPGAMEAGVGDILFWGSLSIALVIAFAFAVPFNRWLIGRGKGHAVIHETGVHGGPPVRVVAAAVVAAAIFGSVVLAAEGFDDEAASGHGGDTAAESGDEAASGHGGDTAAEPGGEAAHGGGAPSEEAGGHGAEDGGGHEETRGAEVRGTSDEQDGLELALADTGFRAGQERDLQFQVLDRNGNPVHHYEVQHERRMHVIVVRRDFQGFQHLHPQLERGTWSVPLRLDEPGSYRVYADFRSRERNYTLAGDVEVPGKVEPRTVADPANLTTTDGYQVRLDRSGDSFRFEVSRGGEPVRVQPYLGASGHLVILRQSDLGYLHVHPESDEVAFEAKLPGAGLYRLFLQFRHEDRVHTAEFTQRQ